MKKSIKLVSVSLVAIMNATSAFAQAPAAAPAEEENAQLFEGEILVTARRREESAQTVPVSVSVLSAEALTERSVRSLSDLTNVTPGIRFTHQGGGGNMNVLMRGLGRIPIGNAPNAVINYFADVPLSFQGSNLPTYDLASVQVLKGPQGTLFGRNAIGGAVVLTPQSPTYDLGGYVRGSYGNYDYKDVEGAVNLPIIADAVALRVAGKISRRDGFTKNLGVGNDMDDIHQDSFRASLLIEPGSGIRNLTVFDWFKAREAGTGSILSVVLPFGLVRVPQLAHFYDCRTINAFNPVGCAAIPNVLPPGNDIDDALALQQQLGVRNTFSDFNQRLDRDTWGVSNKTEVEIGSVTLRNIFGYRKVHLETDLNTDGVAFVPLPIINASNRVRESQVSNEIHIFGNAFDDRLDYLFGGMYIKEKPTGPNGSNFPVASPVAPWVISYTSKTNTALFGQIGFKLTEALKLNAGYRYNKTKQSACAVTDGANLVPSSLINGSEPLVGPGACATAVGASSYGSKENASTYNVGIDWQVSDGIFAYATHRKGYREGGLNYPGFTTPCTTGGPLASCPTLPAGAGGVVPDLRPFQSYKPETLKDVEIGLKTDFRLGGGRARFNIAAYSGNYSNAVVSFNASGIVASTDAGAPQSSAIGINVGKRRNRGFETEILLQPSPNLTFSNSISYTEAKFISTDLPAVQGLSLPSLTPASPKWATSTSVRWVLPFRPADSEIVLNADIATTSKFFNGNDTFKGYEVANARLEWNSIGGTGITTALFMRNIFNSTYAYASSASSASLGIYTRAYSEPRMYGIELGYKF
jgi:iron complex outermembrane recepter protein